MLTAVQSLRLAGWEGTRRVGWREYGASRARGVVGGGLAGALRAQGEL